jgi:starvation-inducible DNA-binding protein
MTTQRAPTVTERIPSGAHKALDASGPVVQALSGVLADTAVLQMKTHAFHWNVRGVGFFQLHTAFQTQYEELFAAVDELAERVRALGAISPGSFAELLKLTAIGEAQNQARLSASDMVGTLAQDHRALEHRCREALKAAQSAGDEATADLMIGRMEYHDKTAWMLDSWLQ